MGELNFRVFQAMACGAAVLTEATDNGLDELFTVGLEVLTYPRGAVAAALSRHSATARALRVLELVRSLQERRA